MAQQEIYEVLKNKLLSGDQSYFTSREIMRMLNGKGISINLTSVQSNIVKLRMFGYLDMRIDAVKKNRTTYPITVYRLRKECLK